MYKTKEIVESEFDEEFVDKKGKSLQTWELNEKAILNPILVKSHLLTVRTEDIEAHIEKLKGMIKELPKTKCLNAENHLFGSCFACEKIKGYNQALSDSILYFEKIIENN